MWLMIIVFQRYSSDTSQAELSVSGRVLCLCSRTISYSNLGNFVIWYWFSESEESISNCTCVQCFDSSWYLESLFGKLIFTPIEVNIAAYPLTTVSSDTNKPLESDGLRSRLNGRYNKGVKLKVHYLVIWEADADCPWRLFWLMKSVQQKRGNELEPPPDWFRGRTQYIVFSFQFCLNKQKCNMTS